MNNSDKLKSVEDFIYDDKVQDILSQINSNVMEFNILEITGMGNQEIKHSNILGWLFDDSEHNLEYQILDGFLKEVIALNKNKNLQSYLYLADKKRDIIIYREKDNIDLLIVDESNKIVITIENKIYANERIDGKDGGQLQKYENTINEKYNNSYAKYFIFLTIDLEKPSEKNKNWLSANHKMITDVIEDILKTKETTTKTKIILESYVDLLKRNGIVADDKLIKLCNKIWDNKEFANAIDILFEYRVTAINSIFNKLKAEYNFNGKYKDLELDGIKKLYHKFNKKWEDSEQIFEIQIIYFGGKNESIWIGFWYPDLEAQKENKLKNICEKITNKKITAKRYKKEVEILRINKEYIENKSINTIFNEITITIKEIDNKIIQLLL